MTLYDCREKCSNNPFFAVFSYYVGGLADVKLGQLLNTITNFSIVKFLKSIQIIIFSQQSLKFTEIPKIFILHAKF